MVKRVCRDCPIPGCGAKYLVRVANHLADVHLLDSIQRRKYLQEAKLQPKIKYIVYGMPKYDQNNIPLEQDNRVYEWSQKRQHQIGKVGKTKVKQIETLLSKKVVKNQNV